MDSSPREVLLRQNDSPSSLLLRCAVSAPAFMLPRLQAPPICLKTSSPAWESQELVGLRLSELWMGEGGREEEGGLLL